LEEYLEGESHFQGSFFHLDSCEGEDSYLG